MDNFGHSRENSGKFFLLFLSYFSIFQTILEGFVKFHSPPDILTMLKIGSNSCFLYRQYYEKTHFSLPPIAIKIPVIMDRSSQAISKNVILLWSFESLCVQCHMEISIALSDRTWLMSSIGINEFGDKNYGWVETGRRGRGKAKIIQWDRTLPKALLFLIFF